MFDDAGHGGSAPGGPTIEGVNEVPSPQLRVSDDEREAALRALGEHLSVGRIDLEEYGERSARVTGTKTRGELAEVFADLPEPHPRFDGQPARAAEVAPTGAGMSWADRPLSQRLAAAAVPLAGILGVVLFFVTWQWWWFLLPAAVAAIGSALWGNDWDHDRRHRGHSQLRGRSRRHLEH
jgi:hypothetical protein